MPKTLLAAALIAAGLAASADTAEARHRRHLGMHGWCRADAAQMMGVRRGAIVLERVAGRTAGGRYELRGVASHGRFGSRPFTCHFNARRVLQGAV